MATRARLLALLGAMGTLTVLSCSDATNPFDDPGNVEIAVAPAPGTDTLALFTGDSVLLTVPVYLPHLIDSVRLEFGDGGDTTLFVVHNRSISRDTAFASHAYADSGSWQVTVTAWVLDGTTRSATTTVRVRPRPVAPGMAISVVAPEFTRDTLIAESLTLAVSGAVSPAPGLALVGARLNGASVAVQGTTPWYVSLSLRPVQWNTLVVFARDTAGREAAETVYVFCRDGLGAPGAPRAGLALCTALEFCWDSVPGATHYALERSTQSPVGGFAAAVRRAASTTCSDTGLATGATYWYRVRAFLDTTYGSFAVRDTGAYSEVCQAATVACWQRTLGGAGDDVLLGGVETQDGYVLSGTTTSSGAGVDDAWVVKLDKAGRVVWERTYGGSESERARAVVRAGNGLAFAGMTCSKGDADGDAWLVRLDMEGNKLWDTAVSRAEVQDVRCLREGTEGALFGVGYGVTGYVSDTIRMPCDTSRQISFCPGPLIRLRSNADMAVWKWGADGKFLWDSTIGGRGSDQGWSVQATLDGGALVLMQECSAGCDAWLIKLSARGAFEWKTVLGGPGEDVGYYLAPRATGGYVVVGESPGTSATGLDCWLVEVAHTGQVVRDTLIGGARTDWGLTALDLPDGGTAVCGTTTSQGAGKSDAWVFAVDAVWRVTWEETYGGAEDEYGLSVISATDGGYLVLAWTESYGGGRRDAYLIKTDCRGNCPLPVR